MPSYILKKGLTNLTFENIFKFCLDLDEKVKYLSFLSFLSFNLSKRRYNKRKDHHISLDKIKTYISPRTIQLLITNVNKPSRAQWYINDLNKDCYKRVMGLGNGSSYRESKYIQISLIIRIWCNGYIGYFWSRKNWFSDT